MSRLSKLNVIIATIISLVVIAIAYLIFVLVISSISLPPDYEEISSFSLKDSINIYKNHYGIPHIIAKNENDIFFAIGWSHAQDRMWQMDVLRRTASGRLSEIFGRESVASDKFMKIIGLKKLSKLKYKQISKKSREILSAYTAGVNEYLEKNEKRLAFEFGALDYHPEKWTPEDCLAIQLLYAFSQSRSFWADLTLGEIAEHISNTKALSLVPEFSNIEPCILDTNYYDVSDSLFKQAYKTPDTTKHNYNIGNISLMLDKVKNSLGFSLNQGASNAFARKLRIGDKTGAILANDTHNELSLPSIWYQMQVSSNKMNITGATFVGLPLFFIGRNDNVAWGMTSGFIDDCDFFIEKIDPKNENFYFAPNGVKKKFLVSTDTVYIKNADPEIFYTRSSDRSGILSDFLPETVAGKSNKKTASSYHNTLKKYVISFSWTAQSKSDEILALYLMNKSQNLVQFRIALNNWGAPSMVFTYADKAGNIGSVPAATIATRGENTIPTILNPGWEIGYSWVNTKRAVLPYFFNPKKNFVSAANNRISRNLPYYLSSFWDIPSRSIRIDELLSKFDEFTARDAQLMQIDALSPFARELMMYCFPTLVQNQNQFNELEKNALRLLLHWDYQMSPHLASPLIFNTFLENLLQNTFKDELGDYLFLKYCSITGFAHRKILELLKTQESEWFDNVWTEKKETRETVIMQSFHQTIKKLKNQFDTDDFSKWKWGKQHTLTLKHLLSNNILLKPSVTEGTYEMSGCITSISNCRWQIGESFEVVSGPSFRFVTDMNGPKVYMSLPGGASGDPLSPNYSDQIQLWLNGGFLTLTNLQEPDEGFELRTTMLPEK